MERQSTYNIQENVDREEEGGGRGGWRGGEWKQQVERTTLPYSRLTVKLK